LTEEAAKHAALVTARRRFRHAPDGSDKAPDGSDKEWRPLSDISDEDWSKTLKDLGFRGYPEREGTERWSDF
jgi:hypothetical protein